MFYFYGGKRRLARYYPQPQHRVIVEPFAGSAAYACGTWSAHGEARRWIKP